MGETMARIVYCSRNCLTGEARLLEQEFAVLLAEARVKNARNGITGALFCSADHFAQAIEGPRPAVERLLEAIQRDSRHRDVVVLETSEVDKRLFADWTMAYVNPDKTERALMTATLRGAFARSTDSAHVVTELLHALVCREQGGYA